MRMHIGDKEQGTQGDAGALDVWLHGSAHPTESPPTSLPTSRALPADWDYDVPTTVIDEAQDAIALAHALAGTPRCCCPS
jgi:hypothetical protein